MNEQWQCKKSYLQNIKNECSKMLEQIKCSYEIEYVPGHSGIVGNEYADKLAKSSIKQNNITE